MNDEGCPRSALLTQTPNPEARVDADMDTLATALYVRTDDLLKDSPQLARWRPAVGIDPALSDAELVTLAVMQALLGYTSEVRGLRYAREHLRHLFPYLPQQPGYNKRLRRTAATIGCLISLLARDTTLWTDDVWVVDSTRWSAAGRGRPPAARSWPDGPGTGTAPVPRGTSGACACICSPLCTACRPASRSPAPGPASARYCRASSMPDPELTAGRAGQILIGDRNYFGADFEAGLAGAGLTLLRPARKGEAERAGSQFFK